MNRVLTVHTVRKAFVFGSTATPYFSFACDLFVFIFKLVELFMGTSSIYTIMRLRLLVIHMIFYANRILIGYN